MPARKHLMLGLMLGAEFASAAAFLPLSRLPSRPANRSRGMCSLRMGEIRDLVAREIIDSRGNPTVEVDLYAGAAITRAAVPSGASTGAHEALEMRDGDKSRYGGKGVRNVIEHIHTIIRPAVKGLDVTNQEALDRILLELDGTSNKAKLGSNGILAVSLASCKAGAAIEGSSLYKHVSKLGNVKPRDIVLPVPWFNVINGGEHAGNQLPVQEIMIGPVGAASFSEAMQIGSEVYHALRSEVAHKYGSSATAVGDEGGFAPPMEDAEEALQLLMIAIEKTGYQDKVRLGMDVAASEFYHEGKYSIFGTDRPSLSSEELLAVYQKWSDQYPIVTIEDPFDEDDWSAFAAMTDSIGDEVQIVGDDLTVTNTERITKAQELKACNGLLLKLNQIGTVTEAIQAFQSARKAGWGVMISHRSGETEDTSIADFAVGLGTGQIKSGAPCRSERTAKYNQLLRIEEEIGPDAKYAGKNFRA